MARKNRYLVGLDVGTSKIATIVGEVTEEGSLDIVGVGTAESQGIRQGVVVNLEVAVRAVDRSIKEAEQTAGIEIDRVILGLSGAHIKGFNSRGVVSVAGKSREIFTEDVGRAIKAAQEIAVPSGREILHVIVQDFVVDEQDAEVDQQLLVTATECEGAGYLLTVGGRIGQAFQQDDPELGSQQR